MREFTARHKLMADAVTAAAREPGKVVRVTTLRMPETMRNYVIAGRHVDLTVVARSPNGRGLGQRVQYRYGGEVVSSTVADVLLTLSEIVEG